MSSTTPETKTATEPEGPQQDPIVDEQTGVYGWFRRNQKLLLYTVGMFVLVFFSVSGPMLALINDWFAPHVERPAITVGGDEVKLEAMDYQVGEQIANRPGALSFVLPMINTGDNGRSEATEVYAILRRAAITEGLGISFAEVDKAIATRLEQSAGQMTSETALAAQAGFNSLAAFRNIVGEAMRIGTLIHLQTLALDSSDASVLEDVLGDREKVKFKVATFDEAKLAEELEAAGNASYEDLTAWVEEKTTLEKRQMDVLGGNEVALEIAGLLLADFDRTQWEDNYLAEFEIAEEELTRLYNTNRERFKQEDETYRALEDEGVAEELTKQREAQEVLVQMSADIREKQAEFTKAEDDAFRQANEDAFTAANVLTEAKAKLEADPDNEDLKKEVADAELAKTQADNNRKAAEEARDQKIAAFDFFAAFTELASDENGLKKGAVTKKVEPRRDAEALKDLDSEELGLGTWEQAVVATYLRKVGQLGTSPANTDKASFLYRATDLLLEPLKPREELEPLLAGAYYKEKAKEQAEEKKAAFEAALLRLAKAKMPDKVAEIEGQRASRIEERFTEWKTEIEADIEHAKDVIASVREGTIAHQDWLEELARLEAELGMAESKREEFGTAVGDEIDSEIAEAAQEFHAAVLDEAAAEAGFVVQEIGPLPRDVARSPRFDKKYDKTAVFLYRSHAELEEGDSTGLVEDTAERRLHCAVVTGVMPLEPSDVRRAEFVRAKKGAASGFSAFDSYASERAYTAQSQAFTLPALEERYAVKRPVGKQSEPSDG